MTEKYEAMTVGELEELLNVLDQRRLAGEAWSRSEAKAVMAVRNQKLAEENAAAHGLTAVEYGIVKTAHEHGNRLERDCHAANVLVKRIGEQVKQSDPGDLEAISSTLEAAKAHAASLIEQLDAHRATCDKDPLTVKLKKHRTVIGRELQVAEMGEATVGIEGKTL